MSPTRTSPASPASWIAESKIVPRSWLHPNSWNVNKQNAFQYAKLLESIKTYGFWDPILARACSQHNDLEILGGYHRWQAAGDLGLEELPVITIAADDVSARKISLIDNELHGQADPKALSELLKDLGTKLDPNELLKGLPYTDDIFKSLTGLSTLPPLPAAPGSYPPAAAPAPAGGAAERWVERTYRMPAGVAEVLDDALAKAKADATRVGVSMSDFEALEILAAEYLAS